MSAGAVAYINAVQEKALKKLFDDKQAFSPESASSFTNKDFDNTDGTVRSTGDFYRYKFIKRVQGTDKFYWDDHGYRKTKKQEALILLIFGIFLFGLFVMFLSAVIRLL